MRKDNLLAKKLKRQVLSINNLIESYFYNLTLFFKNFKKKKLGTNSKVFLVSAVSFILILTYFLLPTLFDKNLIKTEIKNHILKKYNINLKFNDKVVYTLIPTPHYSAKNVSIIRDKKNIGDIKNLKILISSNKFFNFNKVFVKDLVFNKTEFNLQKDDILFFQELLKTEPNENKIIIKNSKIFFKDKNQEVLFMNKIYNSQFFYDSKNLQNVFLSKNEIFNLPFKFSIKNNKFEKKIISNFNSKKIRLNINNEIQYEDKTKNGIANIRFINKNTSFNYRIDKNSLNFFSDSNNNSYKGKVDFKPFYFSADFNYIGLSTKNLFNDDSVFVDLIKTEILNNKNLNAKINVNLQDITNINELNNLLLKIEIEEGEIGFSESNLMWKKDLKISFRESFMSYSDNEIKFIGKIVLDFKDLDNFYKSLQVNKSDRKKIKKIEFDFIYNLDKNFFNFDNIKVDEVDNENLEVFFENFNSSKNRIFNKITFKNFVSNFFKAYAG